VGAPKRLAADRTQAAANRGATLWAEGGLDVLVETGRRHVFLQSWAYVADPAGRGRVGQSGGVLLPEALVKEVLDRGVELSAAIDAFAAGTAFATRRARGASSPVV